MLNSISVFLESYFSKYYNLNPWTNVYGLARSFIALSLLLTLTFTGLENLFPTINSELIVKPIFDFQKLSIFYVFGENLLWGYISSLIILIWVISGYLPQVSGILHWWVTYSYLTSGIIIEGGDQIAAILTLLLIPITITDNRFNHWKKPIDTNRKYLKFAMWSVYCIIVFQVSIVYFHSAVAKFSVKEWLDGTATYYWFTHEVFGVPDFLVSFTSSLLSHTFVVVSFTWGAIILEIFIFGWIFIKRNEFNWKLFLLLAISFHFLIACVFGLVSFMFTMIGALILYYCPKDKTITISKISKNKFLCGL